MTIHAEDAMCVKPCRAKDIVPGLDQENEDQGE
jgi:hypothetical protein